MGAHAARFRQRQHYGMDRQARMFKALASLALAMTGGAGLLAWLEPKPHSSLNDPTLAGNPLLSRQRARQAVGSGDDAWDKPWRAIEVVALVHAVGPIGLALTATVPPDDLHFVIDEDGTVQALPSWTKRGAADGPQRVIRIGVVGSVPDRRLPSTQWLALRALLVELNAHAEATSGALPVKLGTVPDPTGRQGPSPGEHLRELLLRDGFLG